MKRSDWKPPEFVTLNDLDAVFRVCTMSSKEVIQSPNDNLKINVIARPEAFYRRFAKSIFKRMVAARQEGRKFVALLPVSPVKQYPILADMITQYRLPMDHCHLFLMDEYALPDGRLVPENFPFSFRNYMFNSFLLFVDKSLHPPLDQIYTPGPDTVDRYADMIAALGGAEVAYGGIGWSGHLAFIDPMANEWGDLDDMDAFLNQGPRFCHLSPATTMQTSLRAFDSAFPLAPSHAYSIGPAQIRDAAFRSIWCDGYPWQNFIWRYAAHGDVTAHVPATMLQLWPSEINIMPDLAGMRSTNWSVIRDYYKSLPE
jgi:glucosamine-6-phosphate deaminase